VAGDDKAVYAAIGGNAGVTVVKFLAAAFSGSAVMLAEIEPDRVVDPPEVSEGPADLYRGRKYYKRGIGCPCVSNSSSADVSLRNCWTAQIVPVENYASLESAVCRRVLGKLPKRRYWKA
jgi:hypothetical protein